MMIFCLLFWNIVSKYLQYLIEYFVSIDGFTQSIFFLFTVWTFSIQSWPFLIQSGHFLFSQDQLSFNSMHSNTVDCHFSSCMPIFNGERFFSVQSEKWSLQRVVLVKNSPYKTSCSWRAFCLWLLLIKEKGLLQQMRASFVQWGTNCKAIVQSG